MILVTRLNGPPLAINADLIERAETTPDTVLTLIDGTKYLIAETVDELISLMRDHRASILVRAAQLEREAEAPADPPLLRVLSSDDGGGS